MEDKLYSLPVVGALGAIVVATLGLVAYLPGLGFLGSVREGYIPMAPSTAISFIILGIVLLFLNVKQLSATKIIIPLAAASLVSLFGILEVAGHFSGMDLTFEGVLIPAAGELRGIPIARMSPSTGAVFFLSGIAAFLLIFQRNLKQRNTATENISGGLGVLVLLISFIFLLAYFYGTPLLYGRGATIPMALTTALGFLFLSVSISTTVKDVFPLRLLTDNSTASHLLRFILPITLLSALLGLITHIVLDYFFEINPAFLLAALTVLIAMISGLVAILISHHLGNKIDESEVVIKQTNEALLKSEERFRGLFENSLISVLNEDMSEVRTTLEKFRSDGVSDLRQYLESNKQAVRDIAAMVKVLHVNEATLKLFAAKTEDEFIYQIDETFGPSAINVFVDELCAIWDKQKDFQSEVTLRTLDGKDISAIISFRIPETEDGFLSIPVSIIDITERKKAEEELRLAAIAFEAHEAITITDVEANIVHVNSAFTRITGYSEEEVIGRNLRILQSGRQDAEFYQRLWADLINTGYWEGEIWNKRKNGDIYPEYLSITVVYNKNNEATHYIGHFLDITERKQAEKEIARFSRIFEDSLNEIYLFDVDSLKFVQMNRAAQHNLGFSMEELQEMTPVDIKPEFTPESFAELLVPLRKGKKEIIVFETIHQRKDSSIYDVEVHLQLLKLDNEELFVGIILDITDKKKQEAILNQAQKMEAVGQLTGGIAHDFNNLLSIISGNLRFLREDLGETSEDIDELFEDAISAVDDGAELTQRLLGFSRARILHPEYKNVNDTIEESVRFLSRTLADNTELETVLPDETLFINVDPSQLENALLNLSINARDAMPQGGMITISAERYYHGDGDEYSLSLPEGDYVKISVSDTGSGISPENLQHLYEPFYTTKEVGKGSGLGLSMVFGFTQQSKGSCHIDSALGVGTTVSMYFPEVADKRNIDQKPEDEEELFLRGSEVILVVEDDPRVRRVALRDLRKLGCQTLEAENADMAKTIIESGEPVDLLFSDVLMPGEMDGHMLAVWTKENYPQIKILLTSGYSKGKTEVSGDKAHPFPLLRKPYSNKNLARQIKTVLMNVS